MEAAAVDHDGPKVTKTMNFLISPLCGRSGFPAVARAAGQPGEAKGARETAEWVRGVAVGGPEPRVILQMLGVMPIPIFMNPSGPKVASGRLRAPCTKKH